MTKGAKWACAAFLLAALVCLGGVLFYPHPAQIPSGDSLEPPSASHWLGTDDLGIDIFAQICAGFFSSMGIGLAAGGLAFLLGGALGITAGCGGKAADTALSFVMEVLLTAPQLPVMILVGAFLGQSMWNIVWVVALFSWAPVAKIIRAKTVSLQQSGYLRLAKSYGAGPWALFCSHMARELMPLLCVNSLAVIGKAVLQEASLAYLGLSDPLAKSWGMMIQKCVSFRGIYFTEYWKWWLLPPVGMLLLTVLYVRLFARELEKIWVRGENRYV